MADNNSTPVVTLTLDKPRHLKMTLGTLQRLKQKQVQLAELEKLSEGGAAAYTAAVDQLPVILWAMMAHEDPDLTPEQVADLIEFDKLQAAADAINEVMAVSVPKGARNPQPARARSAGARAGKRQQTPR